MFTGIVQKISTIKKIERSTGDVIVIVAKPKAWRLRPGESVAINGICSTLQRVWNDDFSVSYMLETLKRTSVSDWQSGDTLNLEKSLRLQDGLDGHIVAGHIDTTGRIISVKTAGNAYVMSVAVPKGFARFIAPQGSVTLDGVSLTVAIVAKNKFSVALIPYTLQHTNLNMKKKGDTLNVEVDIVAKYIDKLLKK